MITVISLACLLGFAGRVHSAPIDRLSQVTDEHTLPDNWFSDIDTVLDDIEAAFSRWLVVHERPYANNAALRGQRLEVFRSNALIVQRHNAHRGSYLLHLNEFADLTLEEFRSTYLGYNLDLKRGYADEHYLGRAFRHKHVDAPEDVDWSQRGVVTKVKNQGQCGSCWAFSTTGAIEGINAIKTGKLTELSEQELVDCDNVDAGCQGGLMDNAFSFVQGNGGIDTENDYRYWGSFPSFCNRRKEGDRHAVDISGHEDVPENDEKSLMKAVSQQPVSVAVCVNSALQLYHSGIFDGECCTQLNHGVLAVGYGIEDDSGAKFWKIKNSWGSGWGEDGFFRLKRDTGGEGQCGVAMAASYPTKDDVVNPAVPTICDAQLFSLFECPPKNECVCDFNLFGFFCLSYSCSPSDALECDYEKDGAKAWCPTEAPHFDADSKRCLGDEGLNSPVLFSTRAKVRKMRV